MYRITADPQWQDMAWDMFQAIVRYTSTEHANAGIADVVDPETVKIDSMEVSVLLLVAWFLILTIDTEFLAVRDPEVFLPNLLPS